MTRARQQYAMESNFDFMQPRDITALLLDEVRDVAPRGGFGVLILKVPKTNCGIAGKNARELGR